MRKVGKYFKRSLLVGNILLIVAMLFSAWSPHLIHPTQHSLLTLSGFALPLLFVLNLLFVFFWVFCSWRHIFWSLVAFICCAPQLRDYCPLNFANAAPEKTSNVIKVLTYNVQSFISIDKDATMDGLHPILAYIKKQDADIVCIQEYLVAKEGDPHKITGSDVRQVLSAYPYRAFDDEIHGKNGLVLYSKFPILSSKVTRFPYSSNSAAIHEILIADDTLTLVNMHLESNRFTNDEKERYVALFSEPKQGAIKTDGRMLVSKLSRATEKRATQADSLVRLINEYSHSRTLICGDLNDIPVSYVHRTLTADGYDAHTVAGTGLGISYHQNRFYFRIDNIIYRGEMHALYCKVDPSIRTSDHYPMYAYLDLRSPK